MKFEVFQNRALYFFRLRAGNGRILLSSVPFSSRESCLDTLLALQKASADGSRYERKRSGVKFQLAVVDEAGKVIANGSTYSSPASYAQGLYTLSTFCRIATVVDLDRASVIR